MKRLLTLKDHKHTAHKLTHEHTSYRGLFLVLSIFGLSLVLISNSVKAESYVVTAAIQAPIPTTPAVIVDPVDQAIVGSRNIVISGTCPVMTPSIVVTIYNNGGYIGSAGCSAIGEFSGTFSVEYGVNVLVPNIVTITNGVGPVGNPVTVTLPIPAQTSASDTSETGANGSRVSAPQNSAVTATNQLAIKTETPFLVIKPDQSLIWKIVISGGESPYTITVDWGDGKKSVYSANSTGEQTLEHSYKVSKNRLIRISVKDASGKEVYTTIAGVSFTQTSSGVVAGVIGSANAERFSVSLHQIWIMYVLLVSLVPLLWLEARHRKLIVVIQRKRRARKK